ncbi:Calcium-binding EF-hand family protein [Rhynchospora pubera]|uniref:Calcium-binding EF-hand family protein n=1 Tax=Rhynchospora pubera TaxID=906938 RepID=A0AAV8F7T0_9POAL|nr:Calcium-binding EF-hand family protein [Rhynchospora pubera]KAJ4780229.1 Calcium-binding EF-hand family protein [Rhynchospora pubera]KAJ4787126.1 Calcium-binding EF-hand family protein [Rhynchospora pubera]
MKITTLHLQPPFFPKKKGKKKTKSSQSISRSDPPSFGSTDTASSSDQFMSLHDQTISTQELEAILRRLDIKEEEMAAILAENSTGYDIAKMEPADETELHEAFGAFDTDGDGRISAEELHEMLVMLGDEHCTLDECRSMIQMVDRVGAGFVCFDDFVRMMNGGWR